MQLSPDLLTLQIRDTARELCETAAPITLVRSTEDSGVGYDPGLQARFGALGYLLQANALHSVTVHREFGRSLAPVEAIGGPILVSRLLGSLPEHEMSFPGVLEGIADGSVIAVDAAFQFGQGHAQMGLVATTEGAGYQLTGKLNFAAAAQHAQWLLVNATLDGADRLFLVEADTPGIGVMPQASIRGGALASITFEGAVVDARTLLPDNETQRSALELGLREARLAVAAQHVGITEKILEVTRRHLITRKQFKRAIGTFQTLQHKLVDAYADLKAADLSLHDAAWKESEGIADARAGHVARVLAAKAAYGVTHLAGHVFAGYGFMKAHDTQIYFRQAKLLDAAYGDVASSERSIRDSGYLQDYDEMLLAVDRG